MCFHIRSLSVFVTALVLASAVPASAGLIEFTFGGTMATATPIGAPFGSIAPGDAYSLSYIFESTTTDANLLSSTIGSYDGAIQSFALTIGAASFAGVPGPGSGIAVDDESVAGIESYEAAMLTSGFGVTLSTALSAGTLLSDALPTDLSLASFLDPFPFLLFDFGVGGGEGSGGRVTSFSSRVVPDAQVIPLPGSVLLGVVGFGMVGWLRRRHQPEPSAN